MYSTLKVVFNALTGGFIMRLSWGLILIVMVWGCNGNEEEITKLKAELEQLKSHSAYMQSQIDSMRGMVNPAYRTVYAENIYTNNLDLRGKLDAREGEGVFHSVYADTIEVEYLRVFKRVYINDYAKDESKTTQISPGFIGFYQPRTKYPNLYMMIDENYDGFVLITDRYGKPIGVNEKRR